MSDWNEAIEAAADRIESLGHSHFYCKQKVRHEGGEGEGPDANPPPRDKCWQNQQLVAEKVRALKEENHE